jgi:hypothetical protein
MVLAWDSDVRRNCQKTFSVYDISFSLSHCWWPALQHSLNDSALQHSPLLLQLRGEQGGQGGGMHPSPGASSQLQPAACVNMVGHARSVVVWVQ